MGRSFGLAAYRALSRRSSSSVFEPGGTRPKGDLVWIHVAEPQKLATILDLAARLCAARDNTNVVITLVEKADIESAKDTRSLPSFVFFERAPSEHPDAVAAFLKAWSPDVCVWTWGGLRPNLIHQTMGAGCPTLLIDADAEGFDGRRDRWLPEVSRRLMVDFIAILVRSQQGLQRLISLGVPSEKLLLTPALQAGGQALTCSDSDLRELSRMLGGRPVWLATGVQEEEVMTVLSAHRQALRLSHRLLLILHPAQPDLVERIREKALSEGFRLCTWHDGGTPDDNTQIVLSDDARDLGLFFRVAPVSFLGSSLTSGYGGQNPFEAAALGSAVLYGPNVRRYLPFYTRLANAGAARIVNDAQTLGTAVTRLISPDQAAAMAHAGWDVISEGADVVDRVLAIAQATLDARRAKKNAGS
jgi:3-deoxy-D-manno-octulosonic-acid transferase